MRLVGLTLAGAVLIGQVLAAQSVSEVIAEARHAAQTDQNARSAELFATAIALDPSVRRDVLREYADQLSYSGRALEAIPLFREVLAHTRMNTVEGLRAGLGLALALSWTDQVQEAFDTYEMVLESWPHNFEARVGRARMHSWLGRQRTAQREFEAILEDAPEEREAIRGLGRTLTWRARQREASELLRHYLDRFPDDRELIFILAESQHWMGRNDRAQLWLDRLFALEPGHERAMRVQREVHRHTLPLSSVLGGYMDQSDDLTAAIWQLRHEERLDTGRTAVTFSLQRTGYDQRGDRLNILQPGGGLRHRFNDDHEINLWLFGNRLSGGQLDSRSELTGDFWWTVWPDDQWRLDISTNRKLLDNLRSLRAGIATQGVGASADYYRSENDRWTLRLMRDRYSDGNRQRRGELEIDRRVTNGPDIWLGVRSVVFTFEDQLNNGYFNPDRYRSLAATIKGWGFLGKWRIEGNGDLGWEQIRPGDDDKALWIARVQGDYRFADRLSFVLEAQAFSSRLASSGGFSRSTIQASIRHWW